MQTKVRVAVDKIIAALVDGNLPSALARVFIRRGRPCDSWSFCNRLFTVFAGTDDARGYRQWRAVDRQVKSGAKAFHIFIPLVRKTKEVDETTGEEVESIHHYGFGTTAVFRVEDTEGAPLEDAEAEKRIISALPLLHVAETWGIKVDASFRAGWYDKDQKRIGLGVANSTTWLHELCHAADDRISKLKGGQHPDQEIVAQLSASTLAQILGEETDLGYTANYVESYAGKDLAVACLPLVDRVCCLVQSILDQIPGFQG